MNKQKQTPNKAKTKLPDNIIIGITGGTGCGKSTVSSILHHLGAHVIDADKIAKDTLVKGEKILDVLAENFGSPILTSEGELDRNELSKIVFSDPKQLQKLNNITHPVIMEKINEKVNQAKQSSPIIVLDVPIPVEKGFLDTVNEVWVVTADEDARISRLINRSRISETEAKKRINAQLSNEEYLKIANQVIDNTGTFEELMKTVTSLFEKRTHNEL